MKFYDFLDKAPEIGKLVIIEGEERVLADRALEIVLDRLLPADVRELNLSRFTADAAAADPAPIAEALQAMPFLAERRVVVVTDTQTMRAQPRRDFWAIAQNVPDGNTLVILDLLSPRAKTPQPFGALAGRAAQRIDTSANEAARARFVRETLERLGADADVRVVDELAGSDADLAAVRNDLEKLALAGKKISLQDLERETLSIPDPKAYKYANAVVEGKIRVALAIADEMFESDRGAAMILLSALAGACKNLWELARGGALFGRDKYSEYALRPLAPRVGERRARAAYERAVHAIEAIVTGRVGSDVGEHRALVDRISVELSALAR
ncbi:MAG TPA: hypothetical protein VMU38_04015 [Candidatus Binatia bacterium]|nr:hypothetical protein [Candidatus Binatia bacterium]